MPSDGSAKLREIAATLKANNDTALKRKLVVGLRAGAQPLVPAVRQSAIRQLPHAGGLNQQVASQRITISVSMAARTAGVRLKTSAPDTQQTDRGYVRHPTFGQRGPGQWVTQQIPEATGWWTRTLTYKSPAVTAALMIVVNEVAAELDV